MSLRHVLVTLLLLACASRSAIAQVTWKLATGYRAESFHTQNIQSFAAEVVKTTDGALKIDVHPGNSLVALNDVRQAVQDGRVDAGETIMTSMVKDLSLAGADSVPFVVGSYADARRLWALQRPTMERLLAQRGLKLLYSVPWPPQGLYSKRPIADAKDFRGSNMRTYNDTTVRIAQFLGATPVNVAMVDVGKALADGRVDSMITSAVTGVENRVWDHVRYYYEINAWYPKNIVMVNQKRFDALSKEAKAALMRAAESAELRGWNASERAAQESVETLRRNGVKIGATPPGLEREIQRIGERFSSEWVKAVGADALEVFIPYFMASSK
ncbi:MAG TPA: TRAP transporter substrate-binding protein [Casimicrobium huifangae]|jgi:TRAP-type C4-dicarboxylate transport system substrate-binding protein|uniref:TRAP transporter substrate-binding protein n=1 Tax=Casimicrobium huifangae TaxID=2591109 RepID=UPI0012EC62F4|nr:TRAP transporter substrate-binding protein [Casimicrobium huifangae]HOB01763.1 TRAP transporter substrate-binding protein [Casimicrobium huifangae]HQA33882.1 TRAP transporter substrate-binding protein [Casimicrobium huifangae]HQD64190.1 TRAP transporter substrate-binding protein [Casimicrobium huifangae]